MDYTVTTHLLLNNSNYKTSLNEVVAAQEALATTTASSMASVDNAYKTATAAVTGYSNTQSQATTSAVQATTAQAQAQARVVGSHVATGEASVTAAQIQVAAYTEIAVAAARTASVSLRSAGIITEAEMGITASLIAQAGVAAATAATTVAAQERVAVASKTANGSLMGMGGGTLMAALGISLALGTMVKGAVNVDSELATMKQSLENLGLAKASEQFEKIANDNVGFGFGMSETITNLQKFATMTNNSAQAVRLNNFAMDVARNKHMSLASAGASVTMMMKGAARGYTQFGVTLDSTLPKSQAIEKALNEVQKKVSGQMQAHLETTAGKLDKMKASFGRIADIVGREVLPILNALLDGFQRFLPEIAILTTLVTVIYAITKATKIWRAANIALAAVDPFHWMLYGILAVIAIIAILWNRFKVVRDIIIDIANVVLHTFGNLVKFLGFVGEAIVNLIADPLKRVLKIVSEQKWLGAIATGAGKALTSIDKGIASIGTTANTVGDKINSFQKTLDKLRNMKISNPFDSTVPKFDDKSHIKVKLPVVDKIKKPDPAAAADLAAKELEEYLSTVKSLTADIKNALGTLQDSRQKGSDAILSVITSTFGEPTALQKAYNSAEATVESVLSQYENLQQSINDRMVGYAKKDRQRVLDALQAETSVFVVLLNQRNMLDKQITEAIQALDQATSEQQQEMKSMAQSLISYGASAGILVESTASAVIRIVQSTSGAIVTQGSVATNAVESITVSLQKRLETMKAFLVNIKSLQARGLNADYIKQLISAGVGTSGNTVSALASASDAQLAVINSTYDQITQAANSFAQTTGKDLYSAGVTNAQAYLSGLQEQQSAVQAKMTAIVGQIADELAKLAPIGANIGTDTASGLLNNLAAWIKDPKNRKELMANVQAIADEIKAILASAMAVVKPTVSGTTTTTTTASIVTDAVDATTAVITASAAAAASSFHPSVLASQESGAIGAASIAAQIKASAAALKASSFHPSVLASQESGAIGARSIASQIKNSGSNYASPSLRSGVTATPTVKVVIEQGAVSVDSNGNAVVNDSLVSATVSYNRYLTQRGILD